VSTDYHLFLSLKYNYVSRMREDYGDMETVVEGVLNVMAHS